MTFCPRTRCSSMHIHHVLVWASRCLWFSAKRFHCICLQADSHRVLSVSRALHSSRSIACTRSLIRSPSWMRMKTCTQCRKRWWQLSLRLCKTSAAAVQRRLYERVYYIVREFCVGIIEYANVVKCTLVYVYVLPMLSSAPQPALFYPSPLSVCPHTYTMIFFFNTWLHYACMCVYVCTCVCIYACITDLSRSHTDALSVHTLLPHTLHSWFTFSSTLPPLHPSLSFFPPRRARALCFLIMCVYLLCVRVLIFVRLCVRVCVLIRVFVRVCVWWCVCICIDLFVRVRAW